MLNDKINEVKSQNKQYFQDKAKELLARRKEDPLSYASANLLFKSLNLNIEDFLDSPHKEIPTNSQIPAKPKPAAIVEGLETNKEAKPFVVQAQKENNMVMPNNSAEANKSKEFQINNFIKQIKPVKTLSSTIAP